MGVLDDLLPRVFPTSGVKDSPKAASVAEPKSQSGGAVGDSLLNLGAVGASITNQQKLAVEGAAAKADADSRAATIDNKALTEQIGINENAIASQDATRSAQLKVLDGVNGQLSKAKIAIALSDSNNPMDRIKLWALQQSDAGYTREGNTARIQYYQTAADALGGIEAIKQSGFADQIKHSQDIATLAKQPDQAMLQQLQIGLDQGQRVIDAAKSASSDRLTLMTQKNSMQEAQLSNMDDAQTAQAVQQATNSPDKTVNVGGVDLSLAMVQGRQTDLAERKYNQYVKDKQVQDTALANMTTPDITLAITQAQSSKTQTFTTPDGVDIPLARLQARQVDLSNQDVQLKTNAVNSVLLDKQMAATTDEKILTTMTPTELNGVVSNGGIDPKNPAHKYDLKQVMEIRDAKADAQQKALTTEATVAAIGDPKQALADFGNYLDTVKKYAPADGPLANLLKTQDQVFKYAANTLVSKDPQEVAFGATIMQGVREQVEKGIDVEAARLSNGDKMKATALSYQLRGQAIPQDVVSQALSERAAKGQPLTGWLKSQSATAYNNTYAATMSDLTMKGVPKEEARAQAAEAAMNSAMSQASSGMTEQLLSVQLMVPNNPLKSLNISPEQLLAIYRSADVQGIKNYQKNTGASDADIAKITQGGDSNTDLLSAQAGAFYTSLEKMQPGLGDKYTQWWNSPARDAMVNTYAGIAQQQAAKRGFSDLTEVSLVLPTLSDQMSNYAGLIASGQRDFYSAQIQREHADYVTFGGDPKAKQAYLLESDKDLTPSDKQAAMTKIFKPMFDQIAESNMPAAQASTYIESQLQTMQPEDPATKTLLKKILKNRDASLTRLDDFAKIQPSNADAFAQNPMGGIANMLGHAFGFTGAKPTLDRATAGYQWYQDWTKTQQGN